MALQGTGYELGPIADIASRESPMSFSLSDAGQTVQEAELADDQYT